MLAFIHLLSWSWIFQVLKKNIECGFVPVQFDGFKTALFLDMVKTLLRQLLECLRSVCIAGSPQLKVPDTLHTCYRKEASGEVMHIEL